jgi:hypothetical protein
MFRCRHNEVYWEGDAPYYAFGLGAASYLQQRRFSRPRSMTKYRQWVSDFAASGAGVPGVPVLFSRTLMCILCIPVKPCMQLQLEACNWLCREQPAWPSGNEEVRLVVAGD